MRSIRVEWQHLAPETNVDVSTRRKTVYLGLSYIQSFYAVFLTRILSASGVPWHLFGLFFNCQSRGGCGVSSSCSQEGVAGNQQSTNNFPTPTTSLSLPPYPLHSISPKAGRRFASCSSAIDMYAPRASTVNCPRVPAACQPTLHREPHLTTQTDSTAWASRPRCRPIVGLTWH